MTIKEFFGKFKSGFLWGNLLGMAAAVVLFVAILMFGMNIYTKHGSTISVPKLRGKQYTEVEKLLKNAELVAVVVDTDYVEDMPDGCVLDQIPAAGAKVKSGRSIFVTVNSLETPILVLPKIIDNTSLRQATAKLKGMGFKLGTPQMVSGDADWVYGILVDGHNVQNGARIPSNKTLIIQYGNGDSFDDYQYSDEEELFMEVDAEDDAVTEGTPSDDFEEM